MVAISFGWSRGLPFVATSEVKQWLGTAGSALTLLCFVSILVVIVRGYFYSDDPVRLAFPLRISGEGCRSSSRVTSGREMRS